MKRNYLIKKFKRTFKKNSSRDTLL